MQALTAQVQAATGDHVEIAYVDQGYTGPEPAASAAAHGIELVVVKTPDRLCRSHRRRDGSAS